MKAGEIVGLKELLSSHTTYWKERVRKEVEGLNGNTAYVGLPLSPQAHHHSCFRNMKTLKEEREAIVDKLSTICKQADQYQINAGYPVETPAIKIVEALLLSHEEKVRDERDTYWKERVMEGLGKINFLEGITGTNNRDIVLKNYRELRSTLLDNLK